MTRSTAWPSQFTRIIAEHGPQAVAFYVSGQLLTEDYYVANKLMKGFIGSANIDTNSRLCMSSAVAAHKRAFGEDLVPGLLRGPGAARTWSCWSAPTPPGAIRCCTSALVAEKQRRPQLRVVVIDPRRTATCDIADLHLPLRAGTDVVAVQRPAALAGRRMARSTTTSCASTRAALRRALLVAANTAGDVESVARRCGLQPEALQQFYEWFAATPRTVTAFSQGVNQSGSGTDKANSLINCHLLTGRIGKPGMGPFSITGQPNAMGGREVGGMANMLAAHMDLDDAAHRERVQRFWQSPAIAQRPGLKAVDLFKAMRRGQIKAVWIMATNPVVSLPDADRVREALRRCELVVVSDCVADTDTTACAHVLLPAAALGREGRHRDELRAAHLAAARVPAAARRGAARLVDRRRAWRSAWVMARPSTTAARRRSSTSMRASVRFENDGERAFDLQSLAGLGPARLRRHGRRRSGARRSCSPTADSSSPTAARASSPPCRPRRQHARDEEYPLALNTGRIRDQWHTMTRTGAGAAPGRAPARALRRPASAGCAGLRPARRLAGARGHALGPHGGAAALQRRTASRRRVRADPLERLPCLRCARRRAGQSGGRPGVRRAGIQAHAGARRGLPRGLAWRGAVARRSRAAAGDRPPTISWWARAAGSGHQRAELAGRSVPA